MKKHIVKSHITVWFAQRKAKSKARWKKKSFKFGLAFFGLIPLFAIIFSALPIDCWNNPQDGLPPKSFWDFMYFSIVSITTLGFGDIYPTTLLSKSLVATETLGGIIFIGLFLNSLSTEQAKKVSELEEKRHQSNIREIEKNKLYLRKEIIETRLDRYVLSTYCLVTPIAQRDFKNINITPSNIKINDMFDMFNTTMLLSQSIETSSLEMFLRVQDELYEEMSNLTKEVNIGYWPSLVITINNFMSNCVKFDYKDSLLGIKNTRIGNEPASKTFSTFIKDYAGELAFSPSNSINQFIALYKLVVENIKEVAGIQLILKGIFDNDGLTENN